MPQRSQDLSLRRHMGIMGTNARQRAALDWTPLSLHKNGEGLKGLSRFSAPPPSPDKTGGTHVTRASLYHFLDWDGMRERMCF